MVKIFCYGCHLTSADYHGTVNYQSFTCDKVGNSKTMIKGGTTIASVVDAGNGNMTVLCNNKF